MTPELYARWLGQLPVAEPVSVYLHVPFCRSMCWYCGCHTTITAREAPITRYLTALHDEITWAQKAMVEALPARHLHFGGGTPSLMQPQQFMREQRDAGLPVPKLLLPSIQVNIRAGHFDEAEANGITYLRIPVKWKAE